MTDVDVDIKKKERAEPQSILSYGLGFGLRGRLTFWIVLIPMLPMLIIGLVCDQLMENGLRQKAENQMETAISSTSRELDRYFQDMRRQILFLSQQYYTVEFLKNMNNGIALSGDAADVYLKSDEGRKYVSQWQRINKSLGERLYQNTFLADLKGNILASVPQENIMGRNVFTGHYEDSRLARACRQVLRDGGVVFSDFFTYGNMGRDDILGHMVALVFSGNHPIGLIVFECNVMDMNRLMNLHQDLEQSFEMFLVGQDGFLRSDSGTRRNMRALIDRRDVRYLHSTEDGVKDDYDLCGEIYQSPEGVTMLGMHTGVQVGDIRYELVGEMEERSVFALVHRIRTLYWFFSLGHLVFVLTAAYLMAGWVVRPVLSMAEWASNVAVGDLALLDIETRDDELGQFIRNFSQVVVFLKETAFLALSVASGDFNVNIEPRSSNDELGLALEQMTRSLREASMAMAALAGGDFDVNVAVKGPNDLFSKSINSMVAKIKFTHEANENQARMKSLQMELNETLSGDHTIQDLSRRVLSFFCCALSASSGAFYVDDSVGNVFRLESTFACKNILPSDVIHGQGLLGQAALERKPIIIDHCPDGYMAIFGAAETHDVSCVLAFPFIYEGRVVALMELGAAKEMSNKELEFLDLVSENVAIAIMSAESRMKMKELLDKTVKQAEDLKVHQEKLDGINRDLQTKTSHLQDTEAQLRKQEAELRAANIDLVEQTEKLKKSEKRLRLKEEELMTANAALEERSLNLEEQKNAIKQKNLQLEATQKELVEKSQRLESSSRYKSEFLANMSHELRTPLNSILLISRLLSENKTGNLSDKQVEFARTVQASGKDLLTLIDDILDLSKIESGKLELQVTRILVSDMIEKIKAGFFPVCQDKGIGFEVVVDESLPEYIRVDFQRMDQVLKNLVGNAIKFTSRGKVLVTLGFADKLPKNLETRHKRDDVLMIAVKDSGVGIPSEKLALIFDAFKQADGTISRQFGGTGLGLSISKQLVQLMGGDIDVGSELGVGSEFTVYIPHVFESAQADAGALAAGLFSNERISKKETEPVSRQPDQEVQETSRIDDTVFKGKKILIVDDDMRNVFALIHYLEDFGMDIVVAKSGKESLASLAKHPDMDLVIMDIMMPEMGGFEAMEKIRSQARFKNIPVIALTAKAMKGDREKCLEAGASEYLSKPVDMDRLIEVMKSMMCE